MFFTVIARGTLPPSDARSRAFLVIDEWDDWFKYSTLYTLLYVDDAGSRHEIGGVKIGQFGMAPGQRRPEIPSEFDELDELFFSLGQDDSYYENLTAIGSDVRERVLRALRDMALDLDLFERALGEDVTGVSLLRAVGKSSVVGQFHRLSRGGVRLSGYEFTYTAPENEKSRGIALSFSVMPESSPPTNIHVLIGRNGVGKTHLLDQMTHALVDENAVFSRVGSFSSIYQQDSSGLFANIVSVTFSAFDPFEPLPLRVNLASGIQYSYIGLKQRPADNQSQSTTSPKTYQELTKEFASSVGRCRQGKRIERWRRALQALEADPIFRGAEIASLADVSPDDVKARATELFTPLSSGHKVVLLTITRLVETVEERTLVLLDEPESHLHPPLLSAFIRALSDLLIDRNGVAIVATHSPVVLQEVPRSCVWKLRRNGREVVAERPELETFGENVGVLTREVFGLEVTTSGFHKMLHDAAQQTEVFEAASELFNGQLGAEAKAILRSMLAIARGGDNQ